MGMPSKAAFDELYPDGHDFDLDTTVSGESEQWPGWESDPVLQIDPDWNDLPIFDS